MSDLQYVLDRFAIQDLIAAYGLGHDLHQAGQDNNVLAQWEQVFASDAVIDASAVGAPSAMSLREYTELLRGPGLDGTRDMPAHFDAWQHWEGYASVSIEGDTATAVSPFLHPAPGARRRAHKPSSPKRELQVQAGVSGMTSYADRAITGSY